MTVFAGMEAINIKENIDQEDITPMLFDLLDEENSLAEDLSQIDQMFVAEEKFNMAFEQLEALRDSIKEFGLSKGIIKAVDPDGYLEANGIVPAYEELNDLPTKGDHVEIALENMNEKILAVWKKIKELIAFLWKKAKMLFNRILQMFQSYEKILKNMSKKLDKAKGFNVDKLKNKKAKFLSKDDLTTALVFYNSDGIRISQTFQIAIDKIVYEFTKNPNKKSADIYVEEMKMIESFSDELINFIGINININDSGVSFDINNKSSIYGNIEEKLLTDNGYNTLADAKEIISIAMKFDKNNIINDIAIKMMNESQEKFFKSADKIILEAKKTNEETENIEENIKFIKNQIVLTIKFLKEFLMSANNALKAAIAVGNVCISVSDF